MQAQGNLIERIAQAYVVSRGVRVFCVLAVLVSAPTLFVLAGGFPPYAWRLLAQALAQFPTLLAVRGPVVLLALFGLLLLSASLLIVWGALLWLSWRMLAYWRYERRELRKFAADAEEALSQAEELDEQYEEEEGEQEEQPVYWQTGRASLPATRRRVIYPLSPLPAETQDEEYDPDQDEEDAEDEEEQYFLEDDEEENEMGIYRDEDDDEGDWSRRPASRVPNTPASVRSSPSASQMGVTLYDQRLPDPASAAASEGSSDKGHHTSYGRILPFSASPSAGALPHLTSTLYNRVSLPHSVAAPSPQQVATPAKQPAVAPQHIEPTQPASASAKQPAVAPPRIEPTQPASASAKQPAVAPPRIEPAQPSMEFAPDAMRVPILPVQQIAQVARQQSVVPEPALKQVAEPPQQPVQRPESAQSSAPRPVESSPTARRPASAPVPHVVPVRPKHQAPAPAQPPAPRAVPVWPGEPPLVPAQPPEQPGAMQSLVALISTVPMTPPAQVELISTVPMIPPVREPIQLAPPLVRAEAAARQSAAQLVVSTGLDVGLKRRGKPNEDSLLALQNTRNLRGGSCPVGLFVVADGMGGHENGQEASNLVIQSLSKTIMPAIIYGPTDDNYSELLAEGVHHANLEIYQRNRQAKVDMGTTIVAALVIDTTAYIVSAGDSRVYLYRASSGLTQVTRDHSTVARLVESGLLKPEDVYTHPRRNEIYRSLGHHPSEDLDKFILALQPDDVLLLCSDGLWEMVRDHHIQEIIANTAHQPAQTSSALVQAALDGGGKDNISVIVVHIKAALGAQAAWAG